MKSLEIYKRFLLKINKNDTNDGIAILPSHFVLLFNTEALRWLGEKLNDEADNIKLDQLDSLLEANVELKFVKKYDDSVEFQLPDEFYRHASSFSIVNKGDCKGVKIFNFDKKSLGLTSILSDDFNRPQFDFEETPFIITHNKMKIYYDDFDIKKVFATYYRNPKVIDIAGYLHLDGSQSTNIDSDLIHDNIDEILNRMAVEVNRQYQDNESVALRKDAINTETNK